VSRLEQQQQFCIEQGWGMAEIFPLPSDASFRTYTRLIRGNKSVMLMDAPPEHENLGAYVHVGAHLKSLGIHTPDIYAHDLELGFALLEDFGDDTFTRLLENGRDEHTLYERAIEVLVHIQKSPKAMAIKAPLYDESLLLLEAERFIDWFVPAVRRRDVTPAERDIYLAGWADALTHVSGDRSMLVVRDFHVDNLMIVAGIEGIASCGLLDFQDALIGSPAYDLVSLVEDARRDVQDSTRALVFDRYFEAFPDIKRHEFERNMALLGAQRHVKVLGLFARLSMRDNKHIYLKHIPRVLRLLDNCLSIPELHAMRRIIDKMVPGWRTAEIDTQPSSLYAE